MAFFSIGQKLTIGERVSLDKLQNKSEWEDGQQWTNQ